MSESNGKNIGTIEEITGVVVDVAFPDHLPEVFSAVEIEVDGGIDEGNIRKVVSAGAEMIVAGSAVFGGGDPERAVKRLIEAV